MRILFALRHPGTVRNFASTLRLLAERGHHVHLLFAMQDRLGDGRLLWEVTRDRPTITAGEAADKSVWRFWIRLARSGRSCTDYLRYLLPEYANTPALKARAVVKTPPGFAALCRLPLINGPTGHRLLRGVLALIERAIPADRSVEVQIAAEKPDAVIVSPLVDFGSDQVDVVKGAKALGIPTALAVHSWDNLTNKGLIRLLPDRVFVWNDMQKTEAVTMHGVQDSAVVVTGAPSYDQWFERQPSRSRDVFCGEVGLTPTRPFLVYLCSSPFIAPNEAEFIQRWIGEIRASTDPELSQVGILVRPHPENRQPWERIDLSGFRNVEIWPRGGSNPVDSQSKNDYFDSLHHGVAAVGVNTSALIEASIVGRAVYTVRLPGFEGTQDGTLHFHHLQTAGGGLLGIAADFDEHRRQLAGALRDPSARASQLRAFVEAFVRPHGLDRPSSVSLADAIEEVGQLPRPRPERTPAWLMPLRAVLYPVAWALRLAREYKRVSRKRERALRPLSLKGMLQQVVLAPIDLLLRWRPVKDFGKDFVLPRILPYGLESNRPTAEMGAVPRYVQKLSETDLPIVIGPWMGDVLLELLYWIPFLQWVRTQHEFASKQIVALSRGGTASWYAGVSTGYIDLLDFFTPDQFEPKAASVRSTRPEKRRAMGEFDREILRLVNVSIGTRRASHLHPTQMCRLFAPFWLNQLSSDLVASFTNYLPCAAVDPCPSEWALPDTYAAVKFTFNDAFPDTEPNRVFARTLVRDLAEMTDVVLLNTGLSREGGADFASDTMARLHTIDHLVAPRNNLDVQTKILGKASFFAGNYGGLSHLPPYLGVDSLAFSSVPEALSGRHLEVARRGFAKQGFGSFLSMNVADWSLVQNALGVAVGDPTMSLQRLEGKGAGA